MLCTKNLFKILLALNLILSFTFAQVHLNGNDKTPVDEGLEKQVKIDPTKGIVFDNNTTISLLTLSLAQEKKHIKIIFKDASHLPLYYKISRNNKEIKSSQKSAISKEVSFSIEKAFLLNGDNIIFFNARDEVIQKIEIKA